MTFATTSSHTAGPGAGEIAIQARGIDKIYQTRQGEDVVALQDVTFHLKQAEFVSVVGPSGCGKSTLLRILGGLLPLTSGEALLHGTPIRGPRRDIGVVFQNPVLLPWRTVLENALLPIQVHGLKRDQYRSRAQELIDLVGLTGFERRYPFELSGGMQQRTSIIRALIHDPSILLMDEPFGALDAMTREQMNLLIQRVWLEAQKTVFFITHSVSEAVFLADRVLVMSARPGRILDVVEVDLARPRDLDVMTSPEFGEYVRRIRRRLDAAPSQADLL